MVLNVDLFSAGVFDEGAVVADEVIDADALLDAAGVETNGDVFVPPAKGDFGAPNEALIDPKPNDLAAGAGGAAFSASALSSASRAASSASVLYFCASLPNNSASFPCSPMMDSSNKFEIIQIMKACLKNCSSYLVFLQCLGNFLHLLCIVLLVKLSKQLVIVPTFCYLT